MAFTLHQSRFLASPDGAAILAWTEDNVDSWGDALHRRVIAVAERLVAEHGLDPADADAIAPAVSEEVFLRRKAAESGRFRHPGRLLFTPQGYEQATSEVCAAHRAGRFRGLGVVADLTAGCGGDAIHLAGAAERLWCLDTDPTVLPLLAHNLRAHGIETDETTVSRLAASEARAAVALGDAAGPPLGAVDAVLLDPSRRDAAGRRTRDPEQWHPPLSEVVRAAIAAPAGALKLSPLVRPRHRTAPDDLRALALAGELEVVQVGDDVREAVVWWGDLARDRCRATLLPDDPAADAPLATVAGDPGPGVPEPPPPAPGDPADLVDGVLHDPLPALVLADLTEVRARELGLLALDPLARETWAPEPVDDPFLRPLRVLWTGSQDDKHLRRALRGLPGGPGVVRVRSREPGRAKGDLGRRLSDPDAGADAPVRWVVLTRHGGRRIALVCEPPDGPAPAGA